jgi:hypothetical protein
VPRSGAFGPLRVQRSGPLLSLRAQFNDQVSAIQPPTTAMILASVLEDRSSLVGHRLLMAGNTRAAGTRIFNGVAPEGPHATSRSLSSDHTGDSPRSNGQVCTYQSLVGRLCGHI